jgi:hypothetical protein
VGHIARNGTREMHISVSFAKLGREFIIYDREGIITRCCVTNAVDKTSLYNKRKKQ